MKGKRSLFLVLILILVLAAGSYFLFFKKKKKAAKPKPKPIVTATLPTPEPEATPLVTRATPPPQASPGPQPLGTPPPGFPPGMPGMPGATPPPGFPPGLFGPQPSAAPVIPRAESLPTESQPVIDIQMGAPIRTAEGTTLALSQVEVPYAGKAKLKFLWEVVKGPTDALRILDPQALKTRVQIDNLEQPAEVTLKLTVTDGKTEAAEELTITAFPSRLSRVARAGGAWTGVKHMGMNWVASHGNTVEIFNPDFQPIATAEAPFPITQFFAGMQNGKGAVFVQAPEAQWAVLQSDPVTGTKVSQLPSVGRAVRRFVPFQIEGQPFIFALLDRGIELWNLSDPTHPKLKSSLGSFLKDPLFLTFLGRNIYVADEANIHLIDFPAGNLVASLPAGGSVTGLDSFTIEDKNYLLVSIGVDRTQQGRKDYGLRLFEIGADGRLGNEKRLALRGNLPVRKTYVVPGAGRALLAVDGEKGLTLRMAGMAPFEEFDLDGVDELAFVSLSELETGKIQDQPVAVVADGNQLRILQFKPNGEKRYAVTQKDSVPGLVSAAWVEAKGDGSFAWVGDEGRGTGGALTVLSGADLKILKAQNAPEGRFPSAADLNTGGEDAPLLYLTGDFAKLPAGQKDGSLALLNTKDPAALSLTRSPAFLGGVSPQGTLRSLGVAGRTLEAGLKIAVAVSRLAGNVGGSGLMVWTKAPATAGSAFLQEDLAKTANLIPLGDARDVALTADGKWAFVAGGVDGVVAVDVEKKQPMARMSLGSKDWLADRVVLSKDGNLLLVSFIQPANRSAVLKIFGLTPEMKMTEYGTLTGFTAVNTVEGLRAPVPGITDDGLYLFHPHGRLRNVSVFNMSNPAQPAKIAEMEMEGEVRAVQVVNRFKDIFVAMGPAGVAKLEFGF